MTQIIHTLLTLTVTESSKHVWLIDRARPALALVFLW